MTHIFNFLAGKLDKESSKDDNLLESLKAAFKKVKNELDDHLVAINENSQDVHELNDTLIHLEKKIDKLTERLDEIELLTNPKLKIGNVHLSRREQEVFLIFNSSNGLSSSQAAKRLGFTPDMVNMYLINLISKGIPLKKEIVDDVLVFSVEPDFKDMQLRRNILNLDAKLVKQAESKE